MAGFERAPRRLLIPRGRLRISPDDQVRDQEAVVSLDEPQGLAVAGGDEATYGGDDGMDRGHVPFAGGGEAGIDVGATFGNAAELDRRAENLPDRAGALGNEGLGARVAMRAADVDDPGRGRARVRSRLDRLGRAVNRGVLGRQQAFGAAADNTTPAH